MVREGGGDLSTGERLSTTDQCDEKKGGGERERERGQRWKKRQQATGNRQRQQ